MKSFVIVYLWHVKFALLKTAILPKTFSLFISTDDYAVSKESEKRKGYYKRVKQNKESRNDY